MAAARPRMPATRPLSNEVPPVSRPTGVGQQNSKLPKPSAPSAGGGGSGVTGRILIVLAAVAGPIATPTSPRRAGGKPSIAVADEAGVLRVSRGIALREPRQDAPMSMRTGARIAASRSSAQGQGDRQSDAHRRPPWRRADHDPEQGRPRHVEVAPGGQRRPGRVREGGEAGHGRRTRTAWRKGAETAGSMPIASRTRGHPMPTGKDDHEARREDHRRREDGQTSDEDQRADEAERC